MAREFDINASTLGSWVNRHRIESAQEERQPVPGPERARIRELERENVELREKLIFLKKQPPSSRPRLDDARQVRVHRRGKGPSLHREDVRVLEVSRSGSYEWRERPASATAQRRALLAASVAEIFAGSHQTYGYRRVHAALARRGEHCSAELVRALMREQGLIPAQVRAFRPATTAAGDYCGIPDLVGRDFTAERPGIKLVGDITYIHTWEGFLHLATVIDCHSKAVLGWAMADHYRTELIKDAIRMAAGTSLLQSHAVFHADRGSNYTSEEFGRFLTGLGIRRSVGRTGVCWDNAMAESFFSALKNEWLHRFVFTTRAKARWQVIRYIEGFCNHRRLHSALGYRPPLEVLNESLSARTAA